MSIGGDTIFNDTKHIGRASQMEYCVLKCNIQISVDNKVKYY